MDHLMRPAPSPITLNWLVYRVQHVLNRLTRPLTMGVRAVVIDNKDRVLLVRHSYVRGWHFPGGGIEPGESARASVERELAEEANVTLEGEPVLHGIFFNDHATDRDHVAVYVVRAFRQTAPKAADLEIREARFFPWNALPDGATRACRDRVAEIFGGGAVSPKW